MRNLNEEELNAVSGGGEVCERGDNGWGNGSDPTNPGSFSGGTAPSKSTNASAPEAGKINTNPTDSDGR